MEYITHMEKRLGADLGYHESNLRPENGEGCIGKSGLDKNLTLERILEIAYKMDEKPNVIIKAGPRAKWYLKRCPKDLIDKEIGKQKSWRDISRYTMWIIEWKNDKCNEYSKIEYGNLSCNTQPQNLRNVESYCENNKIIQEEKPKKKHVRKSIPLTLKMKVWDTYIGGKVGMDFCFICKLSPIRQISFHAGHVISSKNGGDITVENLRPICQTCNCSMGSQNMYDFIKEYGFAN